MRIAHVTATFPPYHGGTGTVCFNNVAGLAQLGHDVTVFTANYPLDNHTYSEDFSVKRLGALFRIGNAPFLPQLLRLKGFDLVHLHYPFIFGAEMLLLKSLVGMPYVVTYHQDLLYDGMMGTMARVHHALVGQWVLKRARRLLVTSMDYGQSARIAPIVRSRVDTVREIHNGVDPERFHPNVRGHEVRKRYGIAGDDPVILFVGGLDQAHYFKRMEILLHSFSSLPSQHAKLLIVGDGNLKADYQKLTIELGIESRVTFLGRVPDDDLPLYYAACDLLVLPSTTMGEAFGIVLLEAMASNKPVIASDLPGVRTVVDDGETGLLVKPGNVDDLVSKLKILLDEPELRQQMGMRGREKAEKKYAWPIVVRKLEQVYQEVLADGR